VKSVVLALSIATAYVPANSVGAIGEPVIPGLTAAVPRSQRHLLRTWITVDGRDWYVNDICGPRTKALDLAMDNRAEAVAFGRKKVEVRR
jgi:3D (Asp-Asp-Asp) domain-containing protein